MVVEYYVDYGLKIIIIIIIPNQSWLATTKAITVMPPFGDWKDGMERKQLENEIFIFHNWLDILTKNSIILIN